MLSDTGLQSGEQPFGGAADPGMAEGFTVGLYVGAFVNVIAIILQVVVFLENTASPWEVLQAHLMPDPYALALAMMSAPCCLK